MELPVVNIDRWDAQKAYDQYAAAEKQVNGYFKQKEPLYKDLKKLYYQIKTGKKVVDLLAALKMAGTHDNGAPKLAIVDIDTNEVCCRRYKNGEVVFYELTNYHRNKWSFKPTVKDVHLKNVYPIFTNDSTRDHLLWKAPVPLIPPQYLPKEKMNELYILWEVDEWKPVAPVDPWLLKRITNTHFVVLNGWNLTPLERSVMNAHL